jgi:hypothetical protein
MYTVLITRTQDNFNIIIDYTEEDSTPNDTYSECEDMNQILDDIESGNLKWFLLRVRALRCGIELGAEYLGANLYKNVEDILTDDPGLIQDLIDSAIKQARETLAKLQD